MKVFKFVSDQPWESDDEPDFFASLRPLGESKLVVRLSDFAIIPIYEADRLRLYDVVETEPFFPVVFKLAIELMKGSISFSTDDELCDNSYNSAYACAIESF